MPRCGAALVDAAKRACSPALRLALLKALNSAVRDLFGAATENIGAEQL